MGDGGGVDGSWWVVVVDSHCRRWQHGSGQGMVAMVVIVSGAGDSDDGGAYQVVDVVDGGGQCIVVVDGHGGEQWSSSPFSVQWWMTMAVIISGAGDSDGGGCLPCHCWHSQYVVEV